MHIWSASVFRSKKGSPHFYFVDYKLKGVDRVILILVNTLDQNKKEKEKHKILIKE